MKKQTAVQYIIDNYSLGKTLGEMKIILATAKEMEKQQLESSYNHGSFSIIDNGHGDTFEEYYTKTFKSE